MLGLLILVAPPATLVLAAVPFAARSAPARRPYRLRRARVLRGTIITAAGLAVLARSVWATRWGVYHDDGSSAMWFLVSLFGGVLLLWGAAHFVPWMLAALDRRSTRFPRALRLATRRLGGGLARTSAGAASGMIVIATTTPLLILGPTMQAQNEGRYRPLARAGAAVIGADTATEPATVRSIIDQELPGVPLLTAGIRTLSPSFNAFDGTELVGETYVGGQALLRHLTGNPDIPYDPATAVLVSADIEQQGYIPIHYTLSGIDSVTYLPVISVPPPEPDWEALFVPEEAARTLGVTVTPDRFIIDPAHHQVSIAEEERLARRLLVIGFVHVERGFQPTTAWYVVAALPLLAVAAVVRASRSFAAYRVLRRLSAGSSLTLRLLTAARALTASLCSTALGGLIGIGVGLCVLRAKNAYSLEPAPLPSFSPWPAVTALLAGLPVLTALAAALLPPSWLTGRGTAR